jgi:uncharacterized protein YbjQ (UPF0145 family)
MPWFHRKTEEEKLHEAEEKRREAEERAAQQASVAALESGGIPVAAQRRLDEVRRQEGALFTSDLSVNEFLLSRQLGIRPLTQVMGSSVYHVGYQYISSWNMSGELTVISRAFNHARSLALGRMGQEAERAGADVVVGVHIETREIGEKHLEFVAFGTAARVDGAPEGQPPALTNLSGQDLWKLRSAGYWPLGVAAGSTVYHAVPTWGQWAMSSWGGWFNQELTDFTQGLYTARHLAMGRVSQEASKHRGAIGIVGVSIEQKEEEYEVDLGNDRERTDMIFTFHVIGTTIAEVEPRAVPVQPSVVLKP